MAVVIERPEIPNHVIYRNYIIYVYILAASNLFSNFFSKRTKRRNLNNIGTRE